MPGPGLGIRATNTTYRPGMKHDISAAEHPVTEYGLRLYCLARIVRSIRPKPLGGSNGLADVSGARKCIASVEMCALLGQPSHVQTRFVTPVARAGLIIGGG